MLVMCVALPAGAQSTSSKDQVVEIRGVVLDEKGEPLPGATVLITRPQQRWRPIPILRRLARARPPPLPVSVIPLLSRTCL